ncbi:MAG TPA: hypothetical protein VFA78_09675 [Chloroflexota bacterium]|nr:hypothetical protein [Chloroflexota bacterium]
MIAEQTRETAATEDQITPDEFRDGFGEDLQQALDVDTWDEGEDLAAIYRRIEREVREAAQDEATHREQIRRVVFPQLGRAAGAPPGSGVYAADAGLLQRIHRGILFNGGIEACDGTLLTHDSLPLTIFQVGVGLVSYQGNQGTWSHRLFRRDLRVAGGDPVARMMELLERRERRGGIEQPDRRDRLARLARRGILSYAERAILLQRSIAPWRMGHGNPAPFELLTGSGSLDLMIEATRIIRELVEGHQKFVFVASEPSDRMLLTIGEALRPLEFAIVSTLYDSIYGTVEQAHYRTQPVSSDTRWDGVRLSPPDWIRRFRDEVAPRVAVGIFRATRLSPPQLFYAHVDHADLAAHIALADSVLQEHRGFPLLIDLADAVCSSVFGADTLRGPVATAYTDAGVPFRYLSERQSRYL